MANTMKYWFNGLSSGGLDVSANLSGKMTYWGEGLPSEYEFSGTNMQINIGDTWKTVSGLQINIGDAWKTVTKVQINIGDAWKTVFG